MDNHLFPCHRCGAEEAPHDIDCRLLPEDYYYAARSRTICPFCGVNTIPNKVYDHSVHKPDCKALLINQKVLDAVRESLLVKRGSYVYSADNEENPTRRKRYAQGVKKMEQALHDLKHGYLEEPYLKGQIQSMYDLFFAGVYQTRKLKGLV